MSIVTTPTAHCFQDVCKIKITKMYQLQTKWTKWPAVDFKCQVNVILCFNCRTKWSLRESKATERLIHASPVLHPLVYTVTHKLLFKLGVGRSSSGSAGFKATHTERTGLEKQGCRAWYLNSKYKYIRILILWYIELKIEKHILGTRKSY